MRCGGRVHWRHSDSERFGKTAKTSGSRAIAVISPSRSARIMVYPSTCRRRQALRVIANALNVGDVARAQVGTVLLGIPDPPQLSKGIGSRDEMVRLICDLNWSGMPKWDPDRVLEKAGFNPDEPRDEQGRWTSAGASAASRDPRIQLADAGMSDASDDPVAEAAVRASAAARFDDEIQATGNDTPRIILAAVEEDERDPRFGIGGNHPPLEELIPQRLLQSPAGPAVQFFDNLADISGPGDEANLEMGQLLLNNLLHRIHELDPSYVEFGFWPPGFLAGMTWQERLAVINRFRAVLAATIYRVRGDIGPLQEVTLDFMQQTTNAAYDEAVEQYNAGELKVKLSRQVAIGNYIDAVVRARLSVFFGRLGIAPGLGSPIQVNARAYTSIISYRIPDARVGNLAFDVSLTAKRSSDPQIRGFFNALFRPVGVVIIRPNQLGNGSSYVIWRPRGW